MCHVMGFFIQKTWHIISLFSLLRSACAQLATFLVSIIVQWIRFYSSCMSLFNMKDSHFFPHNFGFKFLSYKNHTYALCGSVSIVGSAWGSKVPFLAIISCTIPNITMTGYPSHYRISLEQMFWRSRRQASISDPFFSISNNKHTHII